MIVERLLLLVCTLPLVGCGSRTAGTPETHTPTPLDDYVKCTSSVPVDPGIQNGPKISIRGPSVIDQLLGSPYTDQGATARDPKDGDITGKISVTGLSAVNINLVGDYMIQYNVINSAQTPAVEVVRIVRVNSGTFSAQTARDIGTTGTHMGYYEHLPVHYGDDPNQRFPLIVFIHGWGRARFLDPYTEQAPLSNLGNVNLSGLINGAYGTWDSGQPFIVLSPQKCVDALTFGETAHRMKLFVDYAVNTYKVDTTRIYMGGHSQGSGDTWDYVTNYPRQLAAIFPISGGYGTVSGCALKDTPAWAFAGELDTPINSNQVDTVASINACNPQERAKVTILPGADHDSAETEVLTLSGLGRGMAPNDVYDQSIYNWMLAHKRSQ
jgi:predicted esterase